MLLLMLLPPEDGASEADEPAGEPSRPAAGRSLPDGVRSDMCSPQGRRCLHVACKAGGHGLRAGQGAGRGGGAGESARAARRLVVQPGQSRKARAGLSSHPTCSTPRGWRPSLAARRDLARVKYFTFQAKQPSARRPLALRFENLAISGAAVQLPSGGNTATRG